MLTYICKNYNISSATWVDLNGRATYRWNIKRHIDKHIFKKLYTLKTEYILKSQNILETDISQTDYIYIYMIPEIMAHLETYIQENMKADCTLISNTFQFPTWKPSKIIYDKEKKPQLYIYKKNNSQTFRHSEGVTTEEYSILTHQQSTYMSQTSQKTNTSPSEKEEKSFRETTKRFLEPVRKTPRLSLWSWLFVFTKALWNLGSAYLVSKIIFGIEESDRQLFLEHLHIYIWLMVFIWLFNFFISRVLRRYHFDEMRVSIYKQALSAYTLLSNNRAESIWTWRANSIIQKWCDRRIDMINTLFVDFALSLVVVLTILIYAFIDLGIRWFSAFLGIWLVWISISLYGNKRLQKIRKERKKFVTQADRKIVKYIMSKFEILLSWKRKEELNMVDQIFKKLQSIGLNISVKEIFAVDISYIITAIIACFRLWYAWDAILAGTMWFAMFTLWWMLFGRMRWKIERSVYALTWRYRNWTHVEKLREFLDHNDYISWYDTWDTFVYKQWDIELSNLWFGYKEEVEVGSDIKTGIFQDFSLYISWWKKTALVWPSGSGKSTLIKLIAWYLKADNGCIYIDGQKLSEVSLKSYYAHIWYLTQEPSVFDGSIRENLTYAVWEDIAPKLISQAITNARCDFIYDLPNWLDTEIWERWIRLSGWQRQRLAIAKIFLKNPKIIILDEPTSALDSESEEAVTQAMKLLFDWRTVRVVAHWLQTFQWLCRRRVNTSLQPNIIDWLNYTSWIRKFKSKFIQPLKTAISLAFSDLDCRRSYQILLTA